MRCLAALPLRIREDERARAKARVKSKNRKRRREGGVEAGLMEADARVDDDVRAKCQADALHEVRAMNMLRAASVCRGNLVSFVLVVGAYATRDDDGRWQLFSRLRFSDEKDVTSATVWSNREVARRTPLR